MIKVTKAKWNKISKDFKGVWDRQDKPEYIGKKTVLSGCISNEIGSLLIEGVHFEIIKGECLLCGNTNPKEIEMITLYSDGDGNDCIEKEHMCKEGEGCC